MKRVHGLGFSCLSFAALASPSYAAGDCLATPEIFAATTLAQLAELYYGDIDYQYAIMLATNARVGAGFPFISDPFQLPASTGKKAKLCVPQLAEAEILHNRYATYLEAITDMALAVPAEVSHSLDPITPGKPVTVATWIRDDQLKRYKAQSGGWVDMLPSDTWVTEEPHLKEFCTAFTNTNGGDPELLTLRLEQRLGLAPHSAKTTFVSFAIADPDPAKNVFRPCASAAIDTTSCAIRSSADDDCSGSPDPQSCAAHNLFFYKQYYSSYGVAQPTGFPWTSLGYTFDWALGPADGTGHASFVRFGESEYVVPKGTPVTITGAAKTADYCGVQ
jgi:hypothetical protein